MTASLSLGGIAAIIAASAWAAFVLFLIVSLRPVERLVRSTIELVEASGERLGKLLDQATATASTAQGDLATLDDTLHGVRDITGSAARVTSLLERLVSWPLEKLLAIAGWLSRLSPYGRQDRAPEGDGGASWGGSGVSRPKGGRAPD
ncbi:MAG TPA: hypothetical protein VEM93_10780, partial [Actinomycetota bacterium]|nr:hypothetical protein [Actinomycetota bacterium]